MVLHITEYWHSSLQFYVDFYLFYMPNSLFLLEIVVITFVRMSMLFFWHFVQLTINMAIIL